MVDNNIIVRCNRCKTKNRIPLNRLSDNPVCGKCKTPLPKKGIFDRPVDVTDNTFEEAVIRYPGSVLLDCWAPWCGPCRMVAPILEELAKKYAGRVKIAKLNVDENPVTASRYAIQSIPTMLAFKGGRLMDTLVGALPKATIEQHIHSLL